MSVPIQSIEESLSIAHVSALVAKAGATMDLVKQDYGVDLSVRRIDSFQGKRMDMGVAFDCQLKASINWKKSNNEIIYDLEADAYNKIVYRHENSSSPCILVVLCLPRNQERWLELATDSMTLRECCYYIRLKGALTENKRSIRIKIPTRQRLTPTEISNLIESSKNGELQ
ncbi:DUF4365 domain-containing protein [Microbulbifer sp. ZKSA002]|uniref:DUF4365 domain-containing protein n=1 Tax=Microbulbifer sp. ZKSA002 TaxID=3243388 RepID=UPI0040395ECE